MTDRSGGLPPHRSRKRRWDSDGSGGGEPAVGVDAAALGGFGSGLALQLAQAAATAAAAVTGNLSLALVPDQVGSRFLSHTLFLSLRRPRFDAAAVRLSVEGGELSSRMLTWKPSGSRRQQPRPPPPRQRRGVAGT